MDQILFHHNYTLVTGKVGCLEIQAELSVCRLGCLVCESGSGWTVNIHGKKYGIQSALTWVASSGFVREVFIRVYISV